VTHTGRAARDSAEEGSGNDRLWGQGRQRERRGLLRVDRAAAQRIARRQLQVVAEQLSD